MSGSREKLIADRWNFIDIMEVLGILFVVMYHTTTYDYNWDTDASFLYYFRYFLRSVLSTCVPLFFFANGYLLLNRNFNLKKHIKKSVLLILLTLLWAFIGLFTIMCIEGYSFSVKEFLNYIWYFMPINWINHLWFTGALICVYAFVPLIKHVFDTKRKYFNYFLIMAAVFTFGSTLISYGGSIALDILFGKNYADNINVFNMFNPFRGIYGYAFVYFCIGGLIHDFEKKIRKIRYIKLIALSALIVSCLLMTLMGIYLSGKLGWVWDIVWNGYDTIFTFVNVIAIYILSLGYRGKVAVIRQISNNTLGIFFMHNIIIHLTRNIIIKVPVLCTFAGNLVYSAAILLICLGITLIMKKIPVIKLLVKI